jgi:hypothetical protein
VNSGGKNGLFVLRSSDGQRVQRRAGVLKPRGAMDNTTLRADLRDYQYSLEDAGSAKKNGEAVTLYHVFPFTGRRPTIKRQREEPLLPDKESDADTRLEKRKATPSAAKTSSSMVAASVFAVSLVSLVALVAHSGFQSGPVSEDAACPDGYFRASSACTPCSDCDAQGLNTVQECTVLQRTHYAKLPSGAGRRIRWRRHRHAGLTLLKLRVRCISRNWLPRGDLRIRILRCTSSEVPVICPWWSCHPNGWLQASSVLQMPSGSQMHCGGMTNQQAGVVCRMLPPPKDRSGHDADTRRRPGALPIGACYLVGSLSSAVTATTI